MPQRRCGGGGGGGPNGGVDTLAHVGCARAAAGRNGKNNQTRLLRLHKDTRNASSLVISRRRTSLGTDQVNITGRQAGRQTGLRQKASRTHDSSHHDTTGSLPLVGSPTLPWAPSRQRKGIIHTTITALHRHLRVPGLEFNISH